MQISKIRKKYVITKNIITMLKTTKNSCKKLPASLEINLILSNVHIYDYELIINPQSFCKMIIRSESVGQPSDLFSLSKQIHNIILMRKQWIWTQYKLFYFPYTILFIILILRRVIRIFCNLINKYFPKLLIFALLT